MNKCLCPLLIGLISGIMIGYFKEDEIDDLSKELKKNKKKLARDYQKMMDQLSDMY